MRLLYLNQLGVCFIMPVLLGCSTVKQTPPQSDHPTNPATGSGIPSWVSTHRTVIEKDRIEMICFGHSENLDAARAGGLASCRRSLVNLLPGLNYEISSTVSEGLHGAAANTEVHSQGQFAGLQCEPIREEVVRNSTEFETWALCRFRPVAANFAVKPSRPTPQRTVAETPADTASETPDRQSIGVLYISAVPGCDTVLVRGAEPRNVTCSGNSAVVPIRRGDQELVIQSGSCIPLHITPDEKLLKGGIGHEELLFSGCG